MVLVIPSQGFQHHFLMVSNDHVYIGPLHNVLQYLYSVWIPVNYIAKNIQCVLIGKLDQFQHIPPF